MPHCCPKPMTTARGKTSTPWEGLRATRLGAILPASWQDGPTWQQHTYMTFDMLRLDKEFAVTCCGTAVFQHILNGVTWVLLTQGQAATLGSILRFTFGGMGGTILSGAAQFGKTCLLRTTFSFSWNWFSGQPVHMPCFNAVLDELPPAGA